MRGRSLLPSWNWLNWTVAGVPTTGLPTAGAAQTPGRPFTAMATAYIHTFHCSPPHHRSYRAAFRHPQCRSQDKNPTRHDSITGCLWGCTPMENLINCSERG